MNPGLFRCIQDRQMEESRGGEFPRPLSKQLDPFICSTAGTVLLHDPQVPTLDGQQPTAELARVSHVLLITQPHFPVWVSVQQSEEY